MAASKKNPKVEALPPKKLKEIWSKVPAADWLSICQEFKPDNQWVLQGKTKLKGLCPYHDEKTPSFVIDTQRQSAHCFGSCNQSYWNPIKFFADISGKGYAASIKELQRRFNLKLPAAFTQNAQKIEDNDLLKQTIFRVAHDEFVRMLQNPDDEEFAYAKSVCKEGIVDWFRKRKLPETAAHLWPIGVLPPREKFLRAVDSVGSTEQVRPANDYMGNYLDTCTGAILFFCYTTPTSMGRIKIRVPRDHQDDSRYVIDDPIDNEVGFFGLNMFPHLMNRLHDYPLLCVEGEFDALATIAHQQVQTEHGEVFIIATGGKMEAGDGSVDALEEFGFKHVYLVPDNDKGGVGWAKQMLSANKVPDRVFRWPLDAVRTKDIDEAVRNLEFKWVMDQLQDVNNFPRNHEWAAERLSVDLEDIEENDVEGRYERAAEYGSVLKPAEQVTFAEEISKNYGFDKELVIQDMAISMDTPDGFVARIASKLREEYHFLSQKQLGGASTIQAWSRRKRVMRTFPVNSSTGVRGVLSLDLGNLTSYIQNNLGEPDFLNYKMGPRGEPVQIHGLTKKQMVTHAFADAVEILATSATPVESLEPLGQGIHYQQDVDDEQVVYVVNGTNFFRGTIGDNEVKYRKIDSPVCDRFLFKLSSKPWSNAIKEVEDIERGVEYEPGALFEKVFSLLNAGWKFEGGELDAMFLAADVLYTPISDLFNFMTMIDVTGETHSGKTTLMQFIGGHKYPGYRLCEPSMFLDDFSAAGIRQMMSGMRLRLMLDEFEDSDNSTGRIDRKSSAVREILNMIRSLSAGAPSVRGTSSGEHLDFHIKFPLTVGGIYTMREYRDLNRFVHIRLRHIEGLNDPIVTVQKQCNLEQMREIRRGISLCWLTRLPEVLRTYQEVKDEFSDNSLLPPGTNTRLKDNYLPAATIMKLAYQDYKKFMREFTEMKISALAEQGATRESTVLWKEIFHTLIPKKHFDLEPSTGFVSVAKIISDPSSEYMLNHADLGAYYLSKRKWLVVFWPKIISGVLSRSNQYRFSQFPARLKNIADADPSCVKKEALTSTFMKDEIYPLVGAKVPVDDISVIDVRDVIAISDSREAATSSASQKETMLDDIPEDIVRGNFE